MKKVDKGAAVSRALISCALAAANVMRPSFGAALWSGKGLKTSDDAKVVEEDFSSMAQDLLIESSLPMNSKTESSALMQWQNLSLCLALNLCELLECLISSCKRHRTMIDHMIYLRDLFCADQTTTVRGSTYSLRLLKEFCYKGMGNTRA